MPGARVPIAQRFVAHLVHFTEHLDAHIVTTAMIGGDVMANDMTQGTPDQRNAVARKHFAGPLQRRPVLNLKGNMMQHWCIAANEVDRMVIHAAAHEREVIAHPIRHPEAEYIAIEVRQFLYILDALSHMTEFQRAYTCIR